LCAARKVRTKPIIGEMIEGKGCWVFGDAVKAQNEEVKGTNSVVLGFGDVGG
jgi:hypothetical protein